MELSEALTWVIGGGGAAVIAFWLMERADPDLAPEHKRCLSLVLVSQLACVAFALSVLLGYVDEPTTTQGWIEALFSIAFVAVVGSQAAHGRLRLRS